MWRPPSDDSQIALEKLGHAQCVSRRPVPPSEQLFRRVVRRLRGLDQPRNFGGRPASPFSERAKPSSAHLEERLGHGLSHVTRRKCELLPTSCSSGCSAQQAATRMVPGKALRGFERGEGDPPPRRLGLRQHLNCEWTMGWPRGSRSSRPGPLRLMVIHPLDGRDGGRPDAQRKALHLGWRGSCSQ
jgi:hypothetical protein